MSNSTLDDALRGEPPPEWTRRARAKDDLRERARELRAQGLDYEEIAGRARRIQEFGLAVGTRPPPPGPAQLRGMPEASGRGRPPLLGGRAPGARGGTRRDPRGRRGPDRHAHRPRGADRRRHRLLVRGREEQAVQPQRPRHLHQQRPGADPLLPTIPRRNRNPADATPRFRSTSTRSADVEAAQRFWLEVTGATADQFAAPTLKHHNPKTVRKNVGEDLSRLPPHRRPAERGSLPQDRRLVSGDHERRLTPDMGQTPNPTYCSRGRIRTSVKWTKTARPARLDDPGLFESSLYWNGIRATAAISAAIRHTRTAGSARPLGSRRHAAPRTSRSPQCNERVTGR